MQKIVNTQKPKSVTLQAEVVRNRRTGTIIRNATNGAVEHIVIESDPFHHPKEQKK